ncbi:MAG TPA: alpha-amylase family glycosyl hydrolase [Miltoncostaeaceae bacterium]|nr:alpha-amylase family glycosyl hydrolase [Miltoncostaeaceae bacterium]
MTWWKHAVVYQIYPRSFADSDGDGVGDLPGITAHLDHLVDLGVDALWLSPFYRSPMADFGYDVSDYTDVDPLFGTLADADQMIDAAHARGLRVIVDWVPNHSSDRHPWFQASRSSRDDPRRDWYVWRDGAPDGGPPNGWRSQFSRSGPAWTHDARTGQWYLHSFLPEQPDLNWANPEVEEAMLGTLRFWLERGVDGFRIDVAHLLGTDPVPAHDEPLTPRNADWPRGRAVLRRVRDLLESYGDRMAVGEVYLLDQRRLVGFVADGDGLHLAHNFVFLRVPWEAARIRAVVEEWEEHADGRAWPCWCLENHDHSRVATRFGGVARARAALVLLLALRGTPFLFQGQELGLPDAEVPAARVVDVDGRDPERAPIPWRRPSEAGPGAGFTTGEPWLPIVAEAEELAVEAQAADPASTLALTRALLGLRRAHPALHAGDQAFHDLGEGLLAWSRASGDDRWLALVDTTGRPRRVDASPVLAAARRMLSSRPGRSEAVDVARVELEADEAVLLQEVRP